MFTTTAAIRGKHLNSITMDEITNVLLGHMKMQRMRMTMMMRMIDRSIDILIRTTRHGLEPCAPSEMYEKQWTCCCESVAGAVLFVGAIAAAVDRAIIVFASGSS
jgi:hypothetical protein